MATNDFKVTPKKELRKKKFKLRVRIDGPKRRTDPMAAVVWQKKSGKVKRMLVKLNRKGNGAPDGAVQPQADQARLHRGGQRVDAVQLRRR